MTKFAPGTDLSGIDTMTGLPKGQSRPRSTRRGTVKGIRPRPPMRGPKPPRRGWEGSRPRPDMPSPKPPMGGGGEGGSRPPMFGGGTPKPPRREGPKFGDRNDPRRDRMEKALQDRRRRDLLTGRARRFHDVLRRGTPKPPRGGTIGGTIGAIGGAIGGRPPRGGKTVKGSRPRPPMPSPKPPRREPFTPGGIR